MRAVVACFFLLFFLCYTALANAQAGKSAGEANAAASSQSDLQLEMARQLLDSWSGDPKILSHAYAMLARVLNSEPENYRALKELARCQIMAGYSRDRVVRYGKRFVVFGVFAPGSLESAEAILRKALDAKPDFAEAHVLLGHVYYHRIMLDEAATSLAEAEALGADDPWLDLNWADVLEARGEYEAAVERSRRVLKRSSNLKAVNAAYSHLIENFNRMGEHDKAIALYRQQIERQPANAWLYGNFSNYLRSVGRNDEAIVQARRALEIMDYGAGRHALAMALYGKWADTVAERKYAQGESYFREASAIRPSLNELMAYGASKPQGARLARALIAAKGVSIDARADDGSTALLIATNRCDTQTVRFLLELNADPNLTDRAGWTPLLSAAHAGDVEIVELLLASGANPRETFNGMDAATMAERHGHAELAALIRKRAAAQASLR